MKLLQQLFAKKVSVEDVHREFLTASEDILKEANNILSESAIKKANRLEALGFSTTLPEVLNGKQLIAQRSVAELILKYQMTHPFNRVITEQSVLLICQKYGLLFAEVSRFKGFVPEKNLKEIENFKFCWVVINTFCYNSSDGARIRDSQEIIHCNSREEAEEMVQRIQQENTSNKDMVRYSTVDNRSRQLKIAAPVKDMKINKWEKIENSKIVVPDPVILYPIEQNCYLIVTAWGEEASDPLVINSKMN